VTFVTSGKIRVPLGKITNHGKKKGKPKKGKHPSKEYPPKKRRGGQDGERRWEKVNYKARLNGQGGEQWKIALNKKQEDRE